MSKCENCIHGNMCFSRFAYRETEDVLEDCTNFKDKSLFVELPCKVGTPVYVIERCRCTYVENYRLGHCHKKKQHNTPEILASFMKLDKGKLLKWTGFQSEWVWKEKAVICYKLRQKPFNLGMITEIGKTVFVSRDVAMDRLYEIERETVTE